MDAIAHERAAVPQPPGFVATAGAVVVGFLLAGATILAVAVVATLTGLFGRTGTTTGRPNAIDWPFPHAGAWSVAANAVVTAGVLLACAYWIGRCVGRKTGKPVSTARTFAIVAATGYAPYVAYRGLVPLHFLLALLATTFLVREFAVGVPPLALSPRVRLALAAAGAASLCIPSAYGATHPLWYESFVQESSSSANWSGNRVVFHPQSDRTVRYGLLLENFGLSKVTLLGVSGGSTPLLRVVGAASGIVEPWRHGGRLQGTSLGHGRERFVTLYLRLRGCRHASGTATLDRVTIRYRLDGMTLSQPLPLAIRPTLVCPA